MWELDCEEGWAPNWSFWTVVLEKTLESPLDCKEIQPVHSEGDQPWDFFGRNDAKADTPGLWPPHAKSWLIGKDSDAGRGWGQEEKGMTEDEMDGWHQWLDRRESEWTPGVGDGQGGLACCDSWGHKESDTTEQLICSDLMQYCSLQHRTLLPSPVTSTTGCCFCFGSISLFFLEFFLHWSPAAYWAPTDLRDSSFHVLSFCLFILFMGFSRQEYWSGLPFPSPVAHAGKSSRQTKKMSRSPMFPLIIFHPLFWNVRISLSEPFYLG